MNTTHHTKSIVTAIVAGALAIAAPAGASVLEPVTAGWNPGGNDVSSVTAISHQSGSDSAPAEVGSITALAPPSSGNAPAVVGSVTAISHPTGGNSPTTALTSNPVDPGSVAGFQRTSASNSAAAESTSLSGVQLAGRVLSGTNYAAGVAQQPSSGNGFDLGYAAIGAGAALLLVSLAMLGSAGGDRRRSGSKQGAAIPA